MKKLLSPLGRDGLLLELHNVKSSGAFSEKESRNAYHPLVFPFFKGFFVCALFVKKKLQILLGFGCTQKFALNGTLGCILYRFVTISAEGMVSTGSYRTDVLMN